jgi:hypothetical protein
MSCANLVCVRTVPNIDSSLSGLGVGAEARADEVECGDSVAVEYAEQVLLDELPTVTRLSDPESVVDVQAISDRFAA